MYQFVVQYRFTVLLAALALLIVASPMISHIVPEAEIGIRESLLTVLFAVMLVTAVAAVSATRVARFFAIGIGSLAILSQILNTAVHENVAFVAHHCLQAVFLGVIVVLAVRQLFATTRVALDTISASLCVYLMLGVFWSSLYALVDVYEAGAISGLPGQSPAVDVASDQTERSVGLLYFSYVTLTTLGYGDVTPTMAFSRMLAVTESITGQLFLVVLVARLVGLHIAASRDEIDRV